MTTTIRDIITRAYRRAGLRDANQTLSAADASNGLQDIRALILSLPGMTHWKPVEVDDDYTAGENERVRVNSDDAVTVTIPFAVDSTRSILYCCDQYAVVCEGYDDRAPKDGARVQVTDTNSNSAVTYYYRADLCAWMPAHGLTLDSLVPLNADMHAGLIARLAVDLSASEPDLPLSPIIVAQAEDFTSRCRARYGKRQAVAAEAGVLRASDYPLGYAR